MHVTITNLIIMTSVPSPWSHGLLKNFVLSSLERTNRSFHLCALNNNDIGNDNNDAFNWVGRKLLMTQKRKLFVLNPLISKGLLWQSCSPHHHQLWYPLFFLKFCKAPFCLPFTHCCTISTFFHDMLSHECGWRSIPHNHWGVFNQGRGSSSQDPETCDGIEPHTFSLDHMRWDQPPKWLADLLLEPLTFLGVRYSFNLTAEASNTKNRRCWRRFGSYQIQEQMPVLVPS